MKYFCGFVLIAFAMVSDIALAATIRENFLGLRIIFTPQEYSASDSTIQTRSNQAQEMVREYLVQKRGRSISDFRFFWNSDRLMVNDRSAGTIRSDFALRTVEEWVRQRYHWSSQYELAARFVHRAIADLVSQGAVIGFDASDVNGCSQVAPVLLIMDRLNRAVYSINLYPCQP